MSAAFSLLIAAISCGQVFGVDVIPAFAKSSLLYQNPTTPTLYGIAYCLPLTCQPAAEPPIVLIHGLTYLVRSCTLFAFTWSTSEPPPQFWKTSGGLFDASAIGILVFWRTSFWKGTGLTVTSGCAAWNSFATWSHNALPAPWLALCHQTSVTAFLLFVPLGAASPAELTPRTAAHATTPVATAISVQRFMTSTPPSAGGLRSPSTAPYSGRVPHRGASLTDRPWTVNRYR